MNKVGTLIICAGMAAAGVAADIRLPAPEKAGGKPLMETLAARKSARAYADRDLEPQVLSSLLWVADGISRPDGRRTAPTGLNVQDIDIYVMTKVSILRRASSSST